MRGVVVGHDEDDVGMFRRWSVLSGAARRSRQRRQQEKHRVKGDLFHCGFRSHPAFVRHGAVERGYGRVIQSQVNAELRAVMDDYAFLPFPDLVQEVKIAQWTFSLQVKVAAHINSEPALPHPRKVLRRESL